MIIVGSSSRVPVCMKSGSQCLKRMDPLVSRPEPTPTQARENRNFKAPLRDRGRLGVDVGQKHVEVSGLRRKSLALERVLREHANALLV